jgi:Family of unknown function (DUF5906)
MSLDQTAHTRDDPDSAPLFLNCPGTRCPAPDPVIWPIFADWVADPRWVVWRFEKKLDTDKPTKMPYQPQRPRARAKNNDPTTWSVLKIARHVYTATRRFDGIGLNLLDSIIIAFDVDDCRDPITGHLDPWAADLVKRSGPSYTEITPSGTGIRIYGKTRTKGAEINRKFPVGNGVCCEPYRNCRRYVAMSGNHLKRTPFALLGFGPLIDEVVSELTRAGDARTLQRRAGDERSSTVEHYVIEKIEADDPRLSSLSEDWIELGTKATGPRAGPDQQLKKGIRSSAIFGFACECLRQGIADNVIASCLMNWKIGEHIREQSNVPRALHRAISRAKENVADSALFKMNEKYCVLPIGGKTRVVTWGDDDNFPGRRTIVMTSNLSDFKSLQGKYRHVYKDAAGNTKETKRGTWWIGHPNRRQYDGGMKFMPTRDIDVVGNTLNMWEGFAVAARKPEGKSGAAGCQLFLDHGLKIICSGDEKHFDYLMKREALIAQQRIRTEIAVGLHSEEEGSGKGLWSRTNNRLYGQHAMQVQNPEHVIGKFNPHLEKLLRLTADEALFALDPRHRNALYILITEPMLTIEPKNVDVYVADNHLNIDVISNAKHFLPVSAYSRRFFVPKVSVDKVGDRAYFTAIFNQLNDGGYEALLYHLLHEIDVSDFDVRNVPKTAQLAEQAAYSRKGVDYLVEKACNEALVPCLLNSDSPAYSVTSGYEDQQGFDYFIDRHSDHELRSLGSLKVKRRLAKEWGCITGDAARKDGKSCVLWPSLVVLRKNFEAKYGLQDWMVKFAESEEPTWNNDF